MNRNSDFWLSLVVLGFCAVASVLTLDVPTNGTGGTVGPSFLPWLMIGGMSLFALILLWRSQRHAPAAMAPFGARLLAQLGGFLILMLLYAWAYEPVGYLISSVAFFVVTLLVLGERRLLQLLLVPPGVVGSVYVVFAYAMQVYMP